MPRTKQGSALLTALFIMTLVAIVATAMTTRLQLDIYRTRMLVVHDKLYLASQSVMFWAFNELNNKQNKFTLATTNGLVDKYPKDATKIYPGVHITGELYDLQSKVNLNNLTEKKSIPLFIHLLEQVYPKSTDKERKTLAFTVQDWLSNYDISRGKDAYMTYYLAQKPAYYPSHQLMKSASEFRLLKDVSASIDDALQPYITVLPEATPININTATKPVLMSLGDGLTETQVDELLTKRGPKGIKKIQDLNPFLQQLNIASNQITIQSKYFLSKAYVKSDDFNLIVYVLLKREIDQKGKISVSVIRESFNSP